MQASPVRVISPTVAAADRISRAAALKHARAEVLGSIQADEHRGRKSTKPNGEVVYSNPPPSNSVMPEPRPVKPPRDSPLLNAARTL